MMLRFSPLTFLLVSALGFVLPSPARAQLSIPGKLMTYRTLDLDSGEELERSRSWQVLDAQGARELTAITYAIGTEVVSECTFANGFDRPANRSVRSADRRAGAAPQDDAGYRKRERVQPGQGFVVGRLVESLKGFTGGGMTRH